MAYGPGQVLPLTKAQIEYWQTEIRQAEQLREDKLVRWDVAGNLARYESAKSQQKAGEVNDGSDFADSERKKAGLFYDTPFVSVLPDAESHSTVALLHQELLNTVLDEPMVNAKAMALKAIQGSLVVIQPAPTKIGYTPTIVQVPVPDPMTGQPALDPQGQPMLVPQIVHEEFYWSNLSAQAFLIPKALKDTDFDRTAPWLGYKFRMPTSQLRRAYQVPEEVVIPAASGEHKLYFTDDEGPAPESADDPLCTGTYIEYKASLVDPSVMHPLLIRCLVLVDGLDQPIKHEDAAWLIDPVTKTFNPRAGWTGFSIHPLALRDYPDSAWVPSDSSVTAGLTEEVTEFLGDAKRQRQSNRLINLYDPSKLPPEQVERIEQGKIPANVPVKPEGLQGGKDTVMVPITQLSSGREHYLGLDIFQSKREKVLGISANTLGAEEEGEKTATEISATSRNTEARFEQERQRAVGAWYLSGVRKLSALLVRYGDRLAAEVLGPQRGQQWAQARTQGLLTRFAYAIQIDGGKYLDIRSERKSHLDLYNLTGKDPNVNRVPVLRKVFQTFGYDPAECVVEQLPEPKPEPPSISFAVKAEDLNPTLPHFPFVVKVLRQGGVDIGVDDIMLAQMQAQALGQAGRSPVTGEQEQTETPDPANPLSMIKELSGPSVVPTAGVGAAPGAGPPPGHGGAAETADPVNQHQLSQTGNQSGPPVT